MLTQLVFPEQRRSHVAGTALLGLNALVLAAGIVANLGFEQIGLDLYVVAAVAVLAVSLLVRQPRQPILRYYSVAYVLGLVGAVVAQLAWTSCPRFEATRQHHFLWAVSRTVRLGPGRRTDGR